MDSTVVQKRLVQQFPADFLEILLESFSAESAKVVRGVFITLEGLKPAPGEFRQLSRALWQTIFARIAAGKPPTVAPQLIAEWWSNLPEVMQQEPALRKQIKEHWPEALQIAALNEAVQNRGTPERNAMRSGELLSPGIAAQRNRTAHSQSIDGRAAIEQNKMIGRIEMKEGIHIACAGLVLLHPFLPRFFEAVGVAAEDKLLQPERALSLLHFLATGQHQAPEYELLLPKLLCNVPFETPVESLIDLTAVEEEEAMALLDAVIRHWDALRNTSADGLRGTFLVRPGILTGRDNGDYLLQVERQSFDLLLDQLPWGIGAIKLPWMERMLWVEWWQ